MSLNIDRFRIYDKKWINSALLVRREIEDIKSRANGRDPAIFSTADLKFTNTMLGCNFCINPLPQFTYSADIKKRGRGKIGITNERYMGMGRYYSEAYDDHYQVIHMRFGVTSFNSIAVFLSGFYTPGIAGLARTGRGPGLIFRTFQVAGTVVSYMSWKLIAVRLAGAAFRILMGKSLSRFATLKPAMPLYWNSVQTMVNQIAVNTGVVPRVFGDKQAASNPSSIGLKEDFTANDVRKLIEAFPYGENFFTEKGTIDVYAMANRAQRMARDQLKKEEALFDSNIAATNILNTFMLEDSVTDPKPGGRYQDYINKWLNTELGNLDKGNGDTDTPDTLFEDESKHYQEDKENVNTFIVDTDEKVTQKIYKSYLNGGGNLSSGAGPLKKAWDFFQAELDDGSQFANFRVNYTGAISESWSNTTGESEIASKLSGFAQQARNLKFSAAGGNIIPGMDSIIKAATDVANGFLSGLGAGGIVGGVAAVATGGTNIDIPLMWKDSSVSLPKASYTVPLVIPYNTPITQLLYVYIPLCMLLAGVMPLSTGRASYTSPLLLEFYDKGRMQSRYAIIDSMSVTRGGATNLGFNWDHRAMSYEINFTIQDLSSIMHMPIAMGTGFGAILDGSFVQGFFDDETVYSDYLAVLSSLGVNDQIYYWRKKKLMLTRALLKWEDFTNPRRWMNALGDTTVGRLMSTLYQGIPF